MAKEVTIGLEKLELFKLGADGTAEVTAIIIGDTLEDSLTFTQEDGTTVDINVEESETPVYSKTFKGSRSFTYQIPNPDVEKLAELWGSFDALKGFEEPTQSVVVECKVVVTPSIGKIITFNRVNMSFGFDGSLGKNNALQLNVTGNVIKPVNDLPIVSYKEK